MFNTNKFFRCGCFYFFKCRYVFKPYNKKIKNRYALKKYPYEKKNEVVRNREGLIYLFRTTDFDMTYIIDFNHAIVEFFVI